MGGYGRERSQVVSAFKWVRRGLRIERAHVIDSDSAFWSWVEGESDSFSSLTGRLVDKVCIDAGILD